MTGKGRISLTPKRSLRAILLFHGMGVAVICALAVWWGSVIHRQSERISELEIRLGSPPAEVRAEADRTRRMLVGESSLFILLFLSSGGFIAWFYRREMSRSRALQGFFASVTHEMRTPLTSIRLQAESIADTLPREGGHLPLIGRLLEDTSRLEAQVERTLELARVEGGGLLYTQPLRIKPWLQRLFSLQLENYISRLDVRTEIGDETLLADPTALQVILKNLLENTLKHSKRERPQVEVKSESREGRILLRYRDNGVGAPGSGSRLGTLFHRGTSSQGAGVGLYLIQTLMDRMGGKAAFTGEKGGFEALLVFREGESHE